MMAGYPESVGVIVDNTTTTAPADTAENVLKTLTIDRAVMGYRGGFRVKAAGTASGGAGSKTVTLYWGGVSIAALAIATGAQEWFFDAEFWNADTTQDQKIIVRGYDGLTLEKMDFLTESVDTL